MRFASLALALCLASLCATGCEQRFRVTEGSFDLDALPEAGVTPAGGWQSAPFPTPEQCDTGDGGQPWLPLDGRQSLEIEHGLGRTPSLLLAYVAFDEAGCNGTLASGDIARIQGADDRVVRIENATTEDFFLRLYLE